MSILSIRDLKVDYATQDGTVQAVDGVSLDIDEGQHLGLDRRIGLRQNHPA